MNKCFGILPPSSLSWTDCRFFIRFTSTSVPRSQYCVVCFKSHVHSQIAVFIISLQLKSVQRINHSGTHAAALRTSETLSNTSFYLELLSAQFSKTYNCPNTFFAIYPSFGVSYSVLELPTTKIFSFSQI